MIGVANMLSDCCEGRSPAAAAVSRMSPFSILFLKKCENFCIAYAEVPAGGGSKAMRKIGVYGQEAVKYRYDLCPKAANGAERDTLELKGFRKLRWVLSDEQQAKVDICHKEAMLEANIRLHDQRRAALPDAACSKDRPKVAKADPTYSSTSPPKPQASEPVPRPPPSKQNKAMETLGNDASAPSSGLMRFFGTKAM